MRKLLEESNFLATFNGVLAALNIKEQASMVYLESLSEMKNALNVIENNGIGIYWKNVNDENASTNPIFQIYSHAFASITADVIKKRPFYWKRVLSKDKNDEESNETTEFFSISNLEKQYNDGGKPITALKDVDFHVNKNEVIVMIGPNGAGKSTLLNCIAGAIEPNNGTVSLFGKNSASRLIELQKYLGVVFQDNVIIKSLSIKEHLYMFGAFRGISEHEIEEAIDYYGDQL